jgi:hypothetical protein
MARLISQTGLTAATNLGSPQEGMKWVVKWALIVMHSSSTSGTRQAYLTIVRANNQYSLGPTLATVGSQTATSGTFIGTGDVTDNQNTQYPVTFYQFPEVFAIDVIRLNATLVSGDTVDYYILVEEVSS